MNTEDVFQRATSGFSQVPEDWMPATGTRAFVFEDPILVWLGFHGEAKGFQKDSSPYEFTEFIFEKGRQFEDKWISEMDPRPCACARMLTKVAGSRSSATLSI
jgi:hypothetical protein